MVEPKTTTVTVTVDAEVYRRVEAALAAHDAASDRWMEAYRAEAGQARMAKAARVAAQAQRELAAAYDALAEGLAGVMPLSRPLHHQVLVLERRADNDDEYAASLERAEVAS